MDAFEAFMHDVDKSTKDFAVQNKQKYVGTGIPKPPQITVVETVLEPERTNEQFRAN